MQDTFLEKALSDNRIVRIIEILIDHTLVRGGSRGAEGSGPPIFGKVNFIFFTLYTMSEKIFLKLNLDFIVAEIRGVFGSVGVYACVCESKSWPLLFFVQQRPNFE